MKNSMHLQLQQFVVLNIDRKWLEDEIVTTLLHTAIIIGHEPTIEMLHACLKVERNDSTFAMPSLCAAIENGTVQVWQMISNYHNKAMLVESNRTALLQRIFHFSSVAVLKHMVQQYEFHPEDINKLKLPLQAETNVIHLLQVLIEAGLVQSDHVEAWLQSRNACSLELRNFLVQLTTIHTYHNGTQLSIVSNSLQSLRKQLCVPSSTQFEYLHPLHNKYLLLCKWNALLLHATLRILPASPFFANSLPFADIFVDCKT